MAIERYVVTSCGTKKDTGEFYCWASKIKTWKGGSGLDQNNRIQLAEPHDVGEVLEYSMDLITAK